VRVGRIKQSLTFWPVSRLAQSNPDFARQVAAIGFVAIEMAPEQYWPAIREAGLAIPIVGGHGTLSDGLNRRENHDRIERELRANIRKAAENGIPSLIVFSGNRRGLSDDEGVEICAEGIRRVIRQAEEEGVTLCMELLNSKVDHPDYQCDHTEWGVKVCEAVGSPRFKLLYDIYHMQIMEGDLIRTIKKYIRYIGHFHTAGNPGRHNLDENQEIYYPAVMRAIAESGYDGYVGHEFGPVGDPMAALRQAYEACNV
jgi:hydroxypyruvate isomerase